MKRHHRVVIQTGPSRSVVLLRFLLVVAVAGVVAAGWIYLRDPHGSWFADPDSELVQLREERKRLVRELRAARDELDDLRGQSTFAARACEIDAQACEALHSTVTGLESEMADLHQQLALYRSIVSPDQPHTSIRVLQLSMRQGAKAGDWHYDLILVQPLQRNRTASGRFDLAVEGLQGGEMRSYSLDQLQAGEAAARPFSFRAFQEFGGELRLPSGFLPSRVTVTLSIDTGAGKTATVKETHDWSRLVQAGEE